MEDFLFVSYLFRNSSARTLFLLQLEFHRQHNLTRSHKQANKQTNNNKIWVVNKTCRICYYCLRNQFSSIKYSLKQKNRKILIHICLLLCELCLTLFLNFNALSQFVYMSNYLSINLILEKLSYFCCFESSSSSWNLK